MLVPRNALDYVWRGSLLKSLRPSYSTPRVLHIFVSSDVDAVNALIILQSLLQSESVNWDVHPVFNYTHLIDTIKHVRDSTRATHTPNNPCSMLLINCGGLVNLSEIIGLDSGDSGDHCMLYVLDSHRPFYLENVSDDNERVVVLADGSEQFPDLSQFESLSDRDSDDDEDENNDDIAESERARRARAKRRSLNRREAIRSYYSATYYGMSASLMAYELALMLGQEKQSKILWSAIVGLTDQLLHDRIDYSIYDLSINELNGNVAALVTDEVSLSIDNANIHRSASDEHKMTRITTNTKTGSITFIKHEPRLIHFRHSSLLDSLSWSPFISSRLRRYTPDGEKHIKTILLELSISQAAAKSELMSRDTWIRFDREIDSVIEIHPRLRELRLPTFIRQLSPTCKLTAIDAVYLASALLEQPHQNYHQAATTNQQYHTSIVSASRNKRIRLDPSTDSNSEKENGSDNHSTPSASELLSHQMECWWQSYHLCNDTEAHAVIPRAFGLSKSSLRAFNRIALTLVARKGSITRSGPFRYVIIDDQPELSTVIHPHAVQRLGSLILDCLIEQSEKALMMDSADMNSDSRKPLIIANYMPSVHRYLIIGIAGTMRMTEARQQNRFGVAFRNAANSIQARHFRHDHFETAYFEIGRESLKPFLEYLHTEMIPI